MTIHSSVKNLKPFVRSVAIEVDAKFSRPDWTSTYPGHGENSPQGAYAIDFMCLREIGNLIADYLWTNRVRLSVWYIIWYGRIISRSDGENAKWERYHAADDPNPSKSHKNHVHVSFYEDGTYTAPKSPLPAYVVDPLKVSTTLTANAPFGKKDLLRKPGFRITTGIAIEIRTNAKNEKSKWLVTDAGYNYNLAYLVLESEFKARPSNTIPIPPKPVPPVVNPSDSSVVNGPDASTFKKVAFINPPGVGNWQGVIPTNKYWYLAEARVQADGSEDCYVYRFLRGAEGVTQAAAEIAPFRLNASPGNKVHPTGWGVSESGVLWFTWNGEGSGNDVITANYVSGQSITKDKCQEMHVFTDGNAQIAFNKDNTMASVRVITSKSDIHTLRRKQDILDNKDRSLGTVTIARRPNRVVQGFTLVKIGSTWELRVLVGLKSKKSPFGIERYNAETGRFISTSPLPGQLGREPEGIDDVYVGFKTNNREGIDVYEYSL